MDVPTEKLTFEDRMIRTAEMNHEFNILLFGILFYSLLTIIGVISYFFGAVDTSNFYIFSAIVLMVLVIIHTIRNLRKIDNKYFDFIVMPKRRTLKCKKK